MDPIDIAASLKKQGYSQSRIARKLRVYPSTVHKVIAGKGTSARVANHIAGLLGKPANLIWPDRYEPAANSFRSVEKAK